MWSPGGSPGEGSVQGSAHLWRSPVRQTSWVWFSKHLDSKPRASFIHLSVFLFVCVAVATLIAIEMFSTGSERHDDLRTHPRCWRFCERSFQGPMMGSNGLWSVPGISEDGIRILWKTLRLYGDPVIFGPRFLYRAPVVCGGAAVILLLIKTDPESTEVLQGFLNSFPGLQAPFVPEEVQTESQRFLKVSSDPPKGLWAGATGLWRSTWSWGALSGLWWIPADF